MAAQGTSGEIHADIDVLEVCGINDWLLRNTGSPANDATRGSSYCG
ncbi:MAG: hypothetical protein SFX18_07775 [Pirellulales bacterium]|nr:hypothetical protein [Pirellulales bacterium]